MNVWRSNVLSHLEFFLQMNRMQLFCRAIFIAANQSGPMQCYVTPNDLHLPDNVFNSSCVNLGFILWLPPSWRWRLPMEVNFGNIFPQRHPCFKTFTNGVHTYISEPVCTWIMKRFVACWHQALARLVPPFLTSKMHIFQKLDLSNGGFESMLFAQFTI